MKLLAALALLMSPAFGCDCVTTATPCSLIAPPALAGSGIVFVGRVISAPEGRYPMGIARVAVEEVLQNVPPETSEVNIFNAGTDCDYPLQAGERYVIFAEGSVKDQLHIGGCSMTFPVAGNERVLDALRNERAGGPPRLVGKVLESTGQFSHGAGLAGVTVTAIGCEVQPTMVRQDGSRPEDQSGRTGQQQPGYADPERPIV